jgi:hypothetical protein
MKNKKRGQVAIWVILGIILLASILLFFFLRGGPGIDKYPTVDDVFDVETYLSQCVRENVDEVVDIMLPQGGFVAPENYVYFDNTNIEYLCENIGFYEPCISQHPMLLNEMEQEIKSYVEPRVNDCLAQMGGAFEDRGADVVFADSLDPRIEVDLGDDKISLIVEKKMTISKEGEVRTFDKFNAVVKSPAFNLASIASEIAAQEAVYCYFEFVGYSILYPRYKVTKFAMSEPTEIYTIEDGQSGKKMNIAIRGCAIPPGF